ncbi:MAG: tripartite tricarboxylate transporter substrate binding protein [Pseudomonadota bacterium]
MSRALSAAGLAAACTFALGSAPALAQGKGPGGYPLKPIRFLVPFAPGGTTDLVSRLVSQRLSDELGQQLVVDNRGGAGGTIAAEIVARSAGDGYTLKMNHQGMTFNATLYPKLPFDTAKAFAAIGQVGITPNVLVVNTAVPAKTVNEFVALAKKGGNIPFGSGGMGSSAHLAVELFMLQTGVKMLHVPYKGAGPALADTIGGQVQMMIATLPAAAGHIRAGKLRPLGMSGVKRSPAFPEIPTIAESGVPKYDYDTWYGIFGPASLPRTMVTWLNQTMNRVLVEPDLRKRLADSGLEVETSTPEQMHKTVVDDMARWGKVIREANIRID